MRVKLTKTVLVGGYGTAPIPKGTIVTPSSVEEAKALIQAGYAKEAKADDKSRTIEPSQPPVVSEDETPPVSGVKKPDKK